jgi:DNA polymerase-1
MPKKSLYLVDGANYVFRAYYALPPLSNSKGLPTNALYGYAQMLIKLLKEKRPDYIVVCFDTPEPTFRDELFAGYKANRKEPPDDLQEQFPYVKPLTEALGVSVIEAPGFEADDIIGTIATREKGNYEVYIVSGDKDLMQLISSGIVMLDEMKGKEIGPKEVVEKFGVPPDKVTDVLGLAGDSSDNVPGVPGVGLKTAARLVAEYGSFEGVLENASHIKGAMGRKISENLDGARMSHRLVQIDTSVSLEYDVGAMNPKGICGEGAKRLFEELEFSRLIPLAEGGVKGGQLSREKYGLVTTEKTLKTLCNTLNSKDIISIDLETTSLDPMRAEICGFAIAHAPGEAAYIPVFHQGEGNLPLGLVKTSLAKALEDKSVRKLGQNLCYDLTILKRSGFNVDGVAFDTMLASYVLDPSAAHNLDALSERYLGHRTIKYEDVVGKGKGQRNFSEVSPEEAKDYACEDADVALRLYGVLSSMIDGDLASLYYDIELPLMEVLVDMQIAGMKVDRKFLSGLGAEFSGKIDSLRAKIYEAVGADFNIDSPKQLGAMLFDKMGLPPQKKTKTGYSTSQDVLEDLASDFEIARLVLDYRSLAKLKSTYVDALPELINPATGRVHTSFNQARTATGRLSSSDPNLQNIPARSEEGMRIREAFVAEGGHRLLSADYSQIELRVLAHMSREAALLDAFREGHDVHAMTAAGIFGTRVRDVTKEQRAVGKTVNFATIYGQTAYGLSRQLGIGPDEAARYIRNYFERYPRVARYREEVIEAARRDGYVKTLFGRRRFFPDIKSSNKQLAQMAERMAFNTVFQGTAADIIKKAMIDVHKGLHGVSRRARLVMQVHDELVLEVPDADVDALSEFVRSCMMGAAKLAVPLEVDVGVGVNWAEAH